MAPEVAARVAALADAVRATPLDRWTAADPYLALLVHRAVLDARAAADDRARDALRIALERLSHALAALGRGRGGGRRAVAQGARALARRRGRGPAARPRGAARRRPAALPALDLGARAHAARGGGGAADPRAGAHRRAAAARVHARGRASRGSTGRGPSWAARRRASCSATPSGCPTCCWRRARRGARRSRDGRVPAGVLAAAPADRAEPRGRALPPDDGGVADAVPVPAPARAVGGVRPRVGARHARAARPGQASDLGAARRARPGCRGSASPRRPSTACAPATSCRTTCAPATGWPTACAPRACRARSCRAPRCPGRRTSCCSGSARPRPISSTRSAPVDVPSLAHRRRRAPAARRARAGPPPRRAARRAWRPGARASRSRRWSRAGRSGRRPERGGLSIIRGSRGPRRGCIARADRRWSARDEEVRAAASPWPSSLPAGSARADFVQDVGSPLPTGIAPYGVAAADFNGDGRPDVAAANGDRGQRLGLPARRSRRLLAGGELAGRRDRRRERHRGRATSTATASATSPSRVRDGGAAATCCCARPTTPASTQEGDALARAVRRRPSPPPTSTATARATSSSGAARSDAVYYALRNDAEHRLRGARCSCPSVGHKGAVARRRLHRRRPARHRGHELDRAREHRPLGPERQPHRSPSRPTRRSTSDGQAVRHGGRRLQRGRPPRRGRRRQPERQGRASCSGKAAATSSARARYPAGDGPVGVETADFNSDGRPDLGDRQPGGKRVTVLLRTAERLRARPELADPHQPGGDGDRDRPTSTRTRASTWPWPTSASNTTQHPAQPRRRSRRRRLRRRRPGRRQRRRAAPDRLRRREPGDPARARRTCPATGSTRTASAATRRSRC